MWKLEQGEVQQMNTNKKFENTKKKLNEHNFRNGAF